MELRATMVKGVAMVWDVMNPMDSARDWAVGELF